MALVDIQSNVIIWLEKGKTEVLALAQVQKP